jgi:2-dehydropantoate 2-reductase
VCGRQGPGPLTDLVRREGAACLRAAGIDFVSEEDDRARRGDIVKVLPVAGEAHGGGSSWQSITRELGSIETDYLNGEIVMLGRLFGVPTPANELLQRVADEQARDRRPPGQVSQEELLRRLG